MRKLRKDAGDRAGFCYYKYPLASTPGQYLPGLVILDKEYGVLAIDSWDWTLEDIQGANDTSWTVSGEKHDSPILRLEDYQFSLFPRYQKYRELRHRVSYNFKVLLPNVERADFIAKHPSLLRSILPISPLVTFSCRNYHTITNLAMKRSVGSLNVSSACVNG